MISLREAILAVQTFLSASLPTETGRPISELLQDAIPASWTPRELVQKGPSKVILYSLDLLDAIHSSRGPQLGSKDWSAINALVELVIELGLNKSLSPGVGTAESRRMSRILQTERQMLIPENDRKVLLELIVSQFMRMIDEGGELGESLYKGRACRAVISGLAELSYNPSFTQEDRDKWNLIYESWFISGFTMTGKLSCITEMLQPQSPGWLKKPLLFELSSIPLQSDRQGVRAIALFFIAKQNTPSVSTLNYIGKVIGSVPLRMMPEQYIPVIAPQVFELLDESDVVLNQAAVHIIAYMFPRHLGLVRQYFLDPIRSSLLPSKDDVSRAADIISDDASVAKALKGLETLTSEPFPTLISSLLRPLLLNLYLLSAYLHPTPRSNLKTKVLQLFHRYVKAASSPTEDILYLVHRMLYSSTADGWMWTPGEEGGVAIRRSTSDDQSQERGLEEVGARVEVIVAIVGIASDDVLSEVFVGIMRRWLAPEDDNAMQSFANVHLLQEFLSAYQSQLLKSPVTVIQVCADILFNYTSKQPNITQVTVSMANLGRMVQGLDDEEDGDEAVIMAFNLLSAIISESVQREISATETTTLQTCLESLETIVKTDKNKSLRSEAKNLISFIRARISITHLSSEKHIKSDDDAYQQGMEYIKDPLVPIRAQGLSILRNLILQRSTAVDIDSVLDTMIGLLQDDDSYVYLNAIKAIQTLADIHGESITRKIMDAYGSHTDVDERLRLAETMAGIVRRLGEVFTGDLATQVISRCVRLVSTEEDWRVRVSAVGLASVCCELAPLMAEPAVEMALHLFRMNDLSLGEEGEGAAPLKRGAVAVIAAVLKGGGIDALGANTKQVIRGIKHLARSDGDETVRELAQGVIALLDGVMEARQPNTPWDIRRKIQEL